MPDPFDTLRGPFPEAEPPEPFRTELRERYLRELRCAPVTLERKPLAG